MCGHRVIAAWRRKLSHNAAIRAVSLGGSHVGGGSMARFVGLDVSQKLTSICVADETGARLWRGQCATDPEQIARVIRGHAGEDAKLGIETGPMTPWLVHELRARSLDATCLDARHASAALKMQMNKTGQNDAEGLAQIMRTGWYRSVHVKSLDAHRARALLGARAQLVGMTTRLSNHIRGLLKTFGLLPGAMRGLPFDRRVEALIADRDDLAPIARPMLAAWRQLREQIATFDKEVRALAKKDPACRLLDERARHRGRLRAGACQHYRGSGALCPVPIGRRAHGADTATVSVGRGRSQW
jgi:transposase